MKVGSWAELEGAGELLSEAVQDRGGDVDVGSGQDDDELLAAVTGHDVAVPYGRPHDPGEQTERAVTRVVAERVVQVLEVVEVGHGQRERDVVVAQFPDQVLGGPAVEEPGERIGVGLEPGHRHRADHAEA